MSAPESGSGGNASAPGARSPLRAVVEVVVRAMVEEICQDFDFRHVPTEQEAAEAQADVEGERPTENAAPSADVPAPPQDAAEQGEVV